MSVRCNILLVAPDEDARFLLDRILSRGMPHARLIAAPSAASGFSLAARDSFDAIVVYAPDEDDISLTRVLRNVAPSAPLLAISHLERGPALGAAGATQFLNADRWTSAPAAVMRITPRPNDPFRGRAAS